MAANIGFFKKYMNPVFVETGSGPGYGILLALDAGFKTIYSIELAKILYDHCVKMFKGHGNVHLIFGDSRFVLEELLSKIQEPITFWLDAHISGGLSVGEPFPPLFEEIEIIGRHPIKTHTIIIDDLRCWQCNEEFKEKLSLINPDYVFVIEDGTFPNDILVARLD